MSRLYSIDIYDTDFSNKRTIIPSVYYRELKGAILMNNFYSRRHSLTHSHTHKIAYKGICLAVLVYVN